MRGRLAPILFEDAGPEAARAKRASPAQKVEVSDGARAKAVAKTTCDGLPVRSISTSLG